MYSLLVIIYVYWFHPFVLKELVSDFF
jgi:hypothetical protein